MQPSITWLKEYFATRTNSAAPNEEINYFEAGLMDSLGVIELIEAIESHFHIQFNETHFQERRFSTINGIAEIIQELKGE